LIVDVISDHHHSEDIHVDVDVDVDVGQVFKLPPPPLLAQIQKPNSNYQNDRLQDFVQRDITDQSNFFNSFYSDSLMFFAFCICIVLMCSTYLSVRTAGSCLTLEVISGPSCGLRCSVQSTNPSRLPLTLGRVSPSDLLIKDSEVSGKHALIKWNLDVNPIFLFDL
jgi:protein phosphatase